MWGGLKKVSINVTKAYSGSQPNLTLDPIGTVQAISSGGTFTPVSLGTVNLKVTGQRDISPESVTGQQSGDRLIAPGNVWLENVMSPHVSANISGESPSVWPSFTIQVT